MGSWQESSGVFEARPLRRVLIVEDNASTASALGDMLRFMGFQTRIAASATEALQVVRDYTPAIGIINVASPLTAGYDLLQQLRARPELATCRFIALTGDRAANHSPLALGFQARLTKPVAIETLLATVVAI